MHYQFYTLTLSSKKIKSRLVTWLQILKSVLNHNQMTQLKPCQLVTWLNVKSYIPLGLIRFEVSFKLGHIILKNKNNSTNNYKVDMI